MSDSGDERGRPTPVRSERRLGDGARPRAGLAVFVSVLAVVGIGLPVSGCLNPRPEELPSSSQAANEGVATPVRETCEDNALLAGCELPDQDINASPEPAEPPSDLGGDDPLSDEDELGPTTDEGGAPLPDAGADEAPADAGAP